VIRSGADPVARQEMGASRNTDARISTDGLLGGAYIGPRAGGGFGHDPAGWAPAKFQYTRGSVDLLTLFASFAGGGGGDRPSKCRGTGRDA